MEQWEPSSLQPLGGMLLLAGLFILRELVSGALKEAGKDLWSWAKAKRSGGQAATRETHDGAACSCDHMEASRSESDAAAIGRSPIRHDAASESRR